MAKRTNEERLRSAERSLRGMLSSSFGQGDGGEFIEPIEIAPSDNLELDPGRYLEQLYATASIDVGVGIEPSDSFDMAPPVEREVDLGVDVNPVDDRPVEMGDTPNPEQAVFDEPGSVEIAPVEMPSFDPPQISAGIEPASDEPVSNVAPVADQPVEAIDIPKIDLGVIDEPAPVEMVDVPEISEGVFDEPAPVEMQSLEAPRLDSPQISADVESNRDEPVVEINAPDFPVYEAASVVEPPTIEIDPPTINDSFGEDLFPQFTTTQSELVTPDAPAPAIPSIEPPANNRRQEMPPAVGKVDVAKPARQSPQNAPGTQQQRVGGIPFLRQLASPEKPIVEPGELPREDVEKWINDAHRDWPAMDVNFDPGGKPVERQFTANERQQSEMYLEFADAIDDVGLAVGNVIQTIIIHLQSLTRRLSRLEQSLDAEGEDTE
jgi:hypothetical protein